MPRLIAVKEVRYDGVQRFPGDEFDATDHDAKILCAADITNGPKAKLAHEQTPRGGPAKVMTTRDMLPQSPVEEPSKEDESVPENGRRRYYRRRDLKAEE